MALLVVSSSASSAEKIPLRDVTADGTWDCKDPMGANAGTIVLAEKTYAFIKTDGKLGGYGTLYLIAEETNTPKFAVIGGYLKDELGAQGLSLTGPKDDYENLSGELYLYAAVTADRAQNWYCARRTAP
ncbi:MAG: hypothetical protein WD929_07580 [Steroidobacteraceae bacterium]